MGNLPSGFCTRELDIPSSAGDFIPGTDSLKLWHLMSAYCKVLDFNYMINLSSNS
jgi:hypothetical protein